MNSVSEGCTFLWKIENFSCAWHRKGENIESPTFVVSDLEMTSWRLILYPKEDSNDNYISYYLKRQENSKGSKFLEINYELSFLAEDDTLLQPSIASTATFTKGQWKGTRKFKTRDEVFNSKCLPQDILIAYCRIWISNKKCMGNVKMFANTIINVDKLSFVWSIENFCKMDTSQKNSYAIISAYGENMVTLELFLTGDCSDELINICIKSYNPMVRYFRFDSFLLDVTGNIINCGHLDFRVNDLLQDGKIVLAKKKDLVEKKNLYLPNDTLSLHFECDFPTKATSVGIVRIDHGIPYSKFKNEEAEENLKDPSDGLIDALRSMYSEGLFCDMELRTPTKNFSVHKNILSARSPVFKAMFTNDMKEKTKKCVEITDVDANTLHRMLLYVYADIFENVCWESAYQLYVAADKYQILSLKNKCSTFLLTNLTINNVCEVLVLADMHQDNDLKDSVQDYILQNDKAIFRSSEWKDMMDTHTKLAAETMYLKYYKD